MFSLGCLAPVKRLAERSSPKVT